MFIHMHGSRMPLAVRMDHRLRLRLPRQTIILAAVKGDRSRRMVFFHEYQHVSSSLVNGRATAVNSLRCNRDGRPPSSAAILTASSDHGIAPPGRQHGALVCHHNVGKALCRKDLLHFETSGSQKSVQATFLRSRLAHGHASEN